ncbi:MAG: amidoligase family protein [Planctomycetaceae bacterium]
MSVTPSCYDPWVVTVARGREWHVVADSALVDVPMSQRAEVVTPILVYGDIADLQGVVRAVRHAGARASAHCGIHVHVGAESFDARGLTNLARIVYKQEDLIFAALGVREGRKDRYCRPMAEPIRLLIPSSPPGLVTGLPSVRQGRRLPEPDYIFRKHSVGPRGD